MSIKKMCIKLCDFLFPEIEINLVLNKKQKKKKNKERMPTADDLDAWAEEFEQKFIRERRRKK